MNFKIHFRKIKTISSNTIEDHHRSDIPANTKPKNEGKPVSRCIYCKKISLDKKTWLSDATTRGPVSDTICPYCSEKKFPNLYKQANSKYFLGNSGSAVKNPLCLNIVIGFLLNSSSKSWFMIWSMKGRRKKVPSLFLARCRLR